MLNKKIKGRILGIAVFSILFAVAIFLLPDFVFAQVDTGINSAAGIGLSDTDPRIIIARVIRVALGFLGVIALILILYAGWLYMMSAGAPEKIDKAKKILSSAAIGLVIILSAFAIATFLINYLLGSTMGGPGASGGPGGSFGGGVPSSGNSIIESHYPERDQRDVPRNTSIVVTFKEDMDPAQIIQDTNGSTVLGDWVDANSNSQLDAGEYDMIDENYVLIYKTDDGTATSTLVTDVFANVMPDNRTFRFKPANYLGSPSEEISYSTAFSSSLDKADGTRAFPGVIGPLGYEWSYTVSTIIDVTPPRVVSVIPYPSTTEPRNVVVQINFNEAVSPLSSSGSTISGFNNMVVTDQTGGAIVDGNFYISNQYRTVEFLTEDMCGRNSCGENVYCLPATSSIEVLAKAATLVLAGEATALFPFDGTVDMADNSLDGNKDGTAQGPDLQSGLPPYNANSPDPLTQGDSYRWDFNTSDQILLSAPSILNIYPGVGDLNVGNTEKPTATFDRLLMSSSLIKHAPPAMGSVALYSTSSLPFWLAKTDDIMNKQTTVEIRHSPFLDFNNYTPVFNSGVKDIYQNCYYPSSGTDNFGTTCTPTPTSTPIAYPYCCEGALSTVECN